jgi:hypothetical protein
MTKDEAIHKALKVLNCLNNDKVYETAWVKGAINACEEALEQQEIGDAEIKQMLDDIEWYQQEQRKLIDRIKALEQPAPPEKTTSLEDVIKEFEKDPEMKALLDLARKQVKGMELEQPAQEPYGWYDNHDIYTEKQSDESIALYTHPHQWQNLTDDEALQIYIDDPAIASHRDPHLIKYARAIEQALKEKNT